MKNLKVGLDQGLLKGTEEAEQDRHIKEGEKKAPTLLVDSMMTRAGVSLLVQVSTSITNDLTIKLAAVEEAPNLRCLISTDPSKILNLFLTFNLNL